MCRTAVQFPRMHAYHCSTPNIHVTHPVDNIPVPIIKELSQTPAGSDLHEGWAGTRSNWRRVWDSSAWKN